MILEHRHRRRALAGQSRPDIINLVAVDLAMIETVDGPHGPIDNYGASHFVDLAVCPRVEKTEQVVLSDDKLHFEDDRTPYNT